MTKEFEIKELNNLKYFSGIKVVHSKSKIFSSQQKYIHNLLRYTDKIACKSPSTPIYLNHKLGKVEENMLVNKETYQRLIRKLIYLSHKRPDVVYLISVIKQSVHNMHLQIAHKVL